MLSLSGVRCVRASGIVSLCYSILLEDDSAFVDFAPLKVYKGKEMFTSYKWRLLWSSLP